MKKFTLNFTVTVSEDDKEVSRTAVVETIDAANTPDLEDALFAAALRVTDEMNNVLDDMLTAQAGG